MVPLDPMGPPVVNGGNGSGTNGGADASGIANSYGIATISTNASFRRRDDEYRNKIMGSKCPSAEWQKKKIDGLKSFQHFATELNISPQSIRLKLI